MSNEPNFLIDSVKRLHKQLVEPSTDPDAPDSEFLQEMLHEALLGEFSPSELAVLAREMEPYTMENQEKHGCPTIGQLRGVG